MEIKEITVGELSSFISKLSWRSGLFLQTPSWQQLEQTEGVSTEILGFYKGANLVGGALAVTRKMRGGFTYFYLPKGPLVIEAKYLELILDLLLARYKGRGLFLRIEPSLIINSDDKFIRNTWYKTKSVQPAATLVTDLVKTQDELLAAMHPKTRYNIRLSEKKNLTWKIAGIEELDNFYKLLIETGERDNFNLHNKDHYAKLMELFSHQELSPDLELGARIVEVTLGRKLLAASLVVFSRQTATYLHGASANEGRELMPTYLLHWQTMLQAKVLGFKYYDWWGIGTDKHPQTTWQGITRFKLGFGGQIINYLGTFDYPYQKLLYFLYRGAHQLLN